MLQGLAQLSWRSHRTQNTFALISFKAGYRQTWERRELCFCNCFCNYSRCYFPLHNFKPFIYPLCNLLFTLKGYVSDSTQLHVLQVTKVFYFLFHLGLTARELCSGAWQYRSITLIIIRRSYYLSAEKAMAPHSSTCAWKIPWMEEPGRLQSIGSLRVGHDWETSLSLFTFMHWRRRWQPTPVFLPGESQGRGSLVGCRLWGHRVRHDWSD